MRYDISEGASWTTLNRAKLVLASLFDRSFECIVDASVLSLSARGADKLQIKLILDLLQLLYSKLVFVPWRCSEKLIFCEQKNNRLVGICFTDFCDPSFYSLLIVVGLVD